MDENPGIRSLRKILITGLITSVAKELPPKMGKIKARIRIIPNLSKKSPKALACLLGRRPVRILVPSRGPIGIRLKIARTILNSIT